MNDNRLEGVFPNENCWGVSGNLPSETFLRRIKLQYHVRFTRYSILVILL